MTNRVRRQILGGSIFFHPMTDPAGGNIIINGSISGLAGIPKQAPYAPSKGAVVEMTRQLAVEYATRNIRINCVCPGTIDTPVLQKGMEMSGEPEAFLAMCVDAEATA